MKVFFNHFEYHLTENHFFEKEEQIYVHDLILLKKNLREMNTSIARLIRRNLPDNDRGEMIAVFNNQYDWVMPHMR